MDVCKWGYVLRNFLAMLLGCTVVLASGAVADVQKCTMRTADNGSGGGWVSQEIFLIRDDATGKLQILDGLIATFNKDKPLDAKITGDKPASQSFGWNLLMVNGAGQRTKMQYLATLFKANHELHVMARPIGFSNTFSAVGTCAIYNG